MRKVIYEQSPSISTTYNTSVPDPKKEQITGEALYYLSRFIELAFNKEVKDEFKKNKL